MSYYVDNDPTRNTYASNPAAAAAVTDGSPATFIFACKMDAAVTGGSKNANAVLCGVGGTTGYALRVLLLATNFFRMSCFDGTLNNGYCQQAVTPTTWFLLALYFNNWKSGIWSPVTPAISINGAAYTNLGNSGSPTLSANGETNQFVLSGYASSGTDFFATGVQDTWFSYPTVVQGQASTAQLNAIKGTSLATGDGLAPWLVFESENIIHASDRDLQGIVGEDWTLNGSDYVIDEEDNPNLITSFATSGRRRRRSKKIRT